MGGIQLEKALAITGWMSPVELKWLAHVAVNSKNILEIGSYKGRSTRVLCDNTFGTVTAVDPWNGPYIKDNGSILFDQAKSWPEFERNLKDAKNLRIVKDYFSGFLKDNNETFDFIFIDGDHRYESVLRDIAKGMEILRPKGILAGHDYTHKDWPGVRKAVDEVLPERCIVDSIWFTTKF